MNKSEKDKREDNEPRQRGEKELCKRKRKRKDKFQ